MGTGKGGDFKAEMPKIDTPDKSASVDLQYKDIVKEIENSASKVGLLHSTRKKS